jgi:hypothetical protein
MADNIVVNIIEEIDDVSIILTSPIDGREIELRNVSGYIDWRYVNEISWKHLVALSEITGPAGKYIIAVEFSGNDIKFTFNDTSNIFLLNAKIELKGDQGDKGEKGDKGDQGEKGESGQSWTKKKVISITGYIIKDTIIDVNTSGVNYTVDGDIIDLESSELVFNDNKIIYITQNGVDQEKGVDVLWCSNISFKFNIDLDVLDKILILT